jgi:TRAP-type uncharacterized transport system substrate-binding protein
MGSFKQDVRETFLGISESVQERWYDFTQFLREAWPILVLLLSILMGIWWYADPPPPSHVLLATGSPGGSYEILGKKYAEYFAKKGVTIELVPTKGAQENIERLADRDDPLQAAFVQAGVVHTKDVKGIQSLGAIGYEPVWLFYRGPEIKNSDLEVHNGHLKYFSSKTLSLGAKGSGTYAQANRILEVSGFSDLPQFVNLSGGEAVKALKERKIDGAFIVDGYDSHNVQTLLSDPALNLLTFQRADAYIKIIPYMHVLDVPQGSFDLRRNFPPRDMKLLATTTSLLVDDRMHPALQFLFLEAAREINGRGSFFSKRGEFPSFKDSILPDSPIAVHYEKNNYPLLSAYVPFWLAELINRLIFIFLPFCALAYPILLALPSYRTKRMQNKINRLYGSLKAFEQELVMNFDPAQLNDYLMRLDLLEYEALKIQVSKRLSSDYYALRTSIDYVRNCLNRGSRPYQASGDTNLVL